MFATLFNCARQGCFPGAQDNNMARLQLFSLRFQVKRNKHLSPPYQNTQTNKNISGEILFFLVFTLIFYLKVVSADRMQCGLHPRSRSRFSDYSFIRLFCLYITGKATQKFKHVVSRGTFKFEIGSYIEKS